MANRKNRGRAGSSSRARTAPPGAPDLTARFTAFVAETFPFALEPASRAWRSVIGRNLRRIQIDPDAIDALRPALSAALDAELPERSPRAIPNPTPGVSVSERLRQARKSIAEACDGFLRRAAIAASLTPEEKMEILRGMICTRAVDNQLKTLFIGGQVRYRNSGFQGKGFRSLGQEAIYAAPLRLRRGLEWQKPDGTWGGDVVAPVIRDLGASLAMHLDDDSIFTALNAQMGKAGPPMDGKDFMYGDFSRGVLPATAPLTISTLTVAGIAMAFALEGSGRLAVSFIGEGGSSLGEWHEAINTCAARRLPAVFCLQNNQTALSTPRSEQSAVRVFAEKAAGYGIPGITLDGTDPEAIAAGFAWAAERARAGSGPTLIELVSMRMCGHAHHDDMLYLGTEPKPTWSYPEPADGGYVDRDAYGFWATKDPVATYAARLEAERVLDTDAFARIRDEAEQAVRRQAQRVIDAPWPDPSGAGAGVFAGESPRVHVEVLEGREARLSSPLPPLPVLDPGPAHDPRGQTFLDAVMRGVGDALRTDPRVFVYGEDVGGAYGNAFLLLRPLLDEFEDRIINSTLAEGAVLGVCIGAALAGRRPIGEMQFNDFVATGFNQLVNSAAMIRYRWGGSVPMVVRMPWGGLRNAGPHHSQHTEPWFYRTPGLKIVAPSTPYDARALMAAAVSDPDPVLYYEHIGLYRDPRIKQALDDEPPTPMPLGRAALRRAGSDLVIVSYGAYAHVAMRVAERVAADGIAAAVLDLRSLVPLDRDSLLAVARHCGKVLVVHEDSKTGGIGQSLAAIIQEEVFEDLDAPVRVVGALDTPVPYSPPLEKEYLPGETRVEAAARLLAAY